MKKTRFTFTKVSALEDELYLDAFGVDNLLIKT